MLRGAAREAAAPAHPLLRAVREAGERRRHRVPVQREACRGDGNRGVRVKRKVTGHSAS